MRVPLLLLLVALACQRPAPTPPTPQQSLAGIPATMHTQLGPIRVLVVDSIIGVDSTVNLMGGFDSFRRVIYLQSGLRFPQSVQVLFHELCHVTLFDSGLSQLIPEKMADAICDAVATARTAEVLARLKP